MQRISWKSIFLAAVLAASCSMAKAQAKHPQVCNDPFIDNAYWANFNRAPVGSKTTGECAISLYGGGSWASQAQLTNLVKGSKLCSDPWIGEIYLQTGVTPTATQCQASNYGGGHWSSYSDLSTKIIEYRNMASSPNALLIKKMGPNDLGVTTTGDLINNAGVIVAKQGTYIISQDGNGIKPGGSSGVIGENSSGLLTDNGAAIQVRAGDLIQDGAAYLKGYSVQSVGGKKVIKGKVTHP
jgi:hypothetical protein